LEFNMSAVLSSPPRAVLSQAAPAVSSTSTGLLLLRLSLGTMWIAHALLKLLVFTLPGTAQFFASVGYPGALAYPVFAIELLGGLALVLGVYARQRLGLQHQGRRLGVPGVPGGELGCAVAGR
jgi:DoxX